MGEGQLQFSDNKGRQGMYTTRIPLPQGLGGSHTFNIYRALCIAPSMPLLLLFTCSKDMFAKMEVIGQVGNFQTSVL